VRTSPLSSVKVTYQILDELKLLIEEKEFFLTEKVGDLPKTGKIRPMRLKKGTKLVKDIMTRNVITATPDSTIKEISELLINNHIDQIPIVIEGNKLVGIVTSRDITRALAMNVRKLEKVMTKKVITSDKDEAVDIVIRRLDKYKIDATPVIDKNNRVIGIITIADIMRRGRSR